MSICGLPFPQIEILVIMNRITSRNVNTICRYSTPVIMFDNCVELYIILETEALFV